MQSAVSPVTGGKLTTGTDRSGNKYHRPYRHAYLRCIPSVLLQPDPREAPSTLEPVGSLCTWLVVVEVVVVAAAVGMAATAVAFNVIILLLEMNISYDDDDTPN